MQWEGITPRMRFLPAHCKLLSLGIPIALVGPADLEGTNQLQLIVATEVIEMHEDAASSVRRKKDSTLVVAANAVREGKASAMISAGNTGATMASALLRMGRICWCSSSSNCHSHSGAWLNSLRAD